METIHRSEYVRKAHVRRLPSGKLIKVKRTVVPKTTYKKKDAGSPGVRSRGAKQGPYSIKRGYSPWITHEGKLGGAGYLIKPASVRHQILDKCVQGYGYRSCLGSIMVLERSSSLQQRYGAKLASDRNYLKMKYGGKGSFGRRSK